LDLAKLVFQVHGADASGAVVFRKTLRRARVLEFFRDLPRCFVAMEACGGAHHWAREIGRLGHEVRLIPPIYVKPFVKRQKNDASDAEAICEAAQRPTMRFVAVKSESAQASAAIFRTRDLLVRQRTQLINAVRGQLTEYGLVAAKGTANLPRLLALVDDPGSDLPQATRAMLDVLTGMVMMLAEQISALDREIARRAKEEDMPSRLRRYRVSGQSLRQPSRLLLHRWRCPAKGATSPPGSASRRCNDPPAVSGSSGPHPGWASGPYAVCSSLVQRHWCARPADASRRQDHGWRACSPESRACWLSPRSQTRWRERFGAARAQRSLPSSRCSRYVSD
jgi:hypothetical protein